MSVFYVRISGSDSNNGTSPATAWRTFNKALSSTGISSGDTVYIGAGIYRETTVVGMTSATTETFIIGDIDGTKTGDAGKVIFSNYLINDNVSPSASAAIISLQGRNFLTFQYIQFVHGGSTSTGISTAASASTNIKILDCYFLSYSASTTITHTVGTFGVRLNWIIARCIFIGSISTGQMISFNIPTGTGSDTDLNVLIENCLFISTTTSVQFSSTGSSINESGGITVRNCSSILSTFIYRTVTTRIAGTNFVFPMQVYNCLLYGGNTSIIAAEHGGLIENYNIILNSSVPRILTSVGIQSISDNSMFASINLGNSLNANKNIVPIGMPIEKSFIMGRGDINTSPPTDLLNVTRPAGTNTFLYQGGVSSATSVTLNDTSKNFGSGELVGYVIKILDGIGKGQIKTINASSGNQITCDGKWVTNPNSTSKYVIYAGQTANISIASTGNTSTITDNDARWANNFWRGYTCEITSGAASGQNFIVSGNSPTVLTGYYPINPPVSTGDAYQLYWGGILKSTVSTGSQYTLTDNNANWPVSSGWPTGHFWYGWRCMITEGAASGANFCVSGNTNNTLSGYNSFAITPQSGDKYVLYFNTGAPSGYYPSGYVPNYGVNVVHSAVGCYERYNTAIKETGVVLSGANSIRLFGPAIQDFQVPVSGITTLSVFGYYDDYYLGTNPQLKILNGSGISIADNTATMLGASGQWEQLRLSFTGSSAGVITARLQSNATGIGGSAYFDCWNVS